MLLALSRVHHLQIRLVTVRRSRSQYLARRGTACASSIAAGILRFLTCGMCLITASVSLSYTRTHTQTLSKNALSMHVFKHPIPVKPVDGPPEGKTEKESSRPIPPHPIFQVLGCEHKKYSIRRGFPETDMWLVLYPWQVL